MLPPSKHCLRFQSIENSSKTEWPIDNNVFFKKMKIPLKIITFAWYLRRGVILTKDNLVKCN
jgi:hypothetical protein